MQIGSAEALLLAGSSHPELAQEIADELGVKLGQVAIRRFPDGEVSPEVLEDVYGRDTFILQTIAKDPDRYLIELLMLVDALRRGGARTICAVIPYFGYSRQDRKSKPGMAVGGKLVANLLTQAGVTKVITVDVHAEQLTSFFDIPVEALHGWPAILKAFQSLGSAQVVVAPDLGGVKLAQSYAKALNCPFAIVNKQRIDALNVKALDVIGDVKGKDVLLADDISSTGKTLESAALACREKGAGRIFAGVTHGLLGNNAIELIQKSPIEVLLTSNTVPRSCGQESNLKIRTVSVAPILVQAIERFFS
jgi:ribose-phosphate pyrophosphokinase